jgi:LysM repeat protein
LKALIIIVLALGIFGGAYYAAWMLYLKPQEELRAEKLEPPPPPPPDPSLPDYQKVLDLHLSGDTMAARKGWQDFLEHFPQSSKADEAREYLGRINISLYLSPIQTPEKTLYEVKPGDVISKVANRLQSTPELIMRANRLQGSMLRIKQKLWVPPANFTLTIKAHEQRVLVLQHDKFFCQYPILTMPPQKISLAKATKKGPTPKPVKITGRITENVAWHDGNRVTFTDKTYNEANHWILISPGGHNLYTDLSALPPDTKFQKPPGGGYGLSPENMQELSALIRKNDSVTIE